MTAQRQGLSAWIDQLCVSALFGWRNLWVEVLELAGLDTAIANERVDFALLQADYSPKSVCGQLPFIDQPVERPRGQSQRGRRFFGGEPIAICLRHDVHRNTISGPLSPYRFRNGHNQGAQR